MPNFAKRVCIETERHITFSLSDKGNSWWWYSWIYAMVLILDGNSEHLAYQYALKRLLYDQEVVLYDKGSRKKYIYYVPATKKKEVFYSSKKTKNVATTSWTYSTMFFTYLGLNHDFFIR